MRLFFILFLLVCVCAASYSPRKSSDKETASIKAAIVKKKQTKELPPLPEPEDDDEDMDGADDEEDEDTVKTDEKEKKSGKPEKPVKQKSKKKPTKPTKKTYEIPDIPESDIPNITSAELFETERFHRIEHLKELISETSAKDVAKIKEIKDEIKDEEDEQDLDDSQYQACNGDPTGRLKDDELCHCDMNEISCNDIVLESEDPHLRTPNLKIVKKKFVVWTANFSSNGITRLQENKVLPGHEKTISILDFSFNEIRYIDSNVFINFKNLSKLNLANNNLQQIKKKWFTPLGETLHRLDLSSNKITELSDGIFEGLPKLKKLILDGNVIKNWKKEYFRGLDDLEQLSIDNCKIEELPGDLFELLPSLTGVSIRNNPIDEIPRALSNSKNLKIIDISETNIAEIHENAFLGDTLLEEILLEKMKFLTAVRDCAFCGLTKLESLIMSNSPKLREIHPNAFGYIKSDPGKKAASVKELRIQNCNISIITEDLLNYDTLETFTIGDNPWNCTCETSFMMDHARFPFKQDSSHIICASPEELKGKVIGTVEAYQACNEIKSEHRTGRLMKLFVLCILTVFISIGGYYLYTSGLTSKWKRRAFNVPEVAYRNIQEGEEALNMDNDFEPRPAEV